MKQRRALLPSSAPPSCLCGGPSALLIYACFVSTSRLSRKALWPLTGELFYGGVLNLDIEMRVMHSQRGKPCGWVEEALKKEKEEEHSVDTVQRAKLQ